MQERASRQDLVVPPKGVSVASLVIGVVLCGLAGFAVVWVAGIGRTVPATNLPLPDVATGEPLKAASSPPAGLVEATPAESLPPSRFSAGSPDHDPAVQPASDFSEISASRFSTQPMAFEKPVKPSTVPTDTTDAEKKDLLPPPLSRFSNRQLSPPEHEQTAKPPRTKAGDDSEATAAGPIKPDATESTTVLSRQVTAPTQPATQAAEKAVSPASVTSFAMKPEKTLDKTPGDSAEGNNLAGEATAIEAEGTMEATASTTAATALTTRAPAVENSTAETPTAPQTASATTKDLTTPLSAKPTETAAAVGSTDKSTTIPTAAASTAHAASIANPAQPEPPATVATLAPPAAQPEDKRGSLNTTQNDVGTAPLTTPPQPLATNDAAAPLTAGANPFARSRPKDTPPAKTPLQNTGVAMPFAAAPPVGKPPKTEAKTTPPAQLTPPPASLAGKTTGQGRPGVPQLEGIQTPQLTIEKSGPRDLQVGKPARFEVSIRNVGAATAYDTLLHDAVPFGTTLITTVPPASPAGTNEPSGTLLWAIGELKPGQEARVAMEVMPEQEGEVGSVASVSFRADATVRSRVTKPALAIVAEPLIPTLIGQPMTVGLTLTNPGTGTATGVVVEGLLPEAVSHPAGREVEFDVGQLKPGETKEITLVLQTVTPGVHEVILGARADGNIEVSQKLRAEITAPALELAADIPSRRYLQRPATCTIRMSNTGTAPALAVELAAQLPDGMKFVRANHAGYYDERTNRVLWSLEELPAGEVGTVDLVVMPTTLGPQPLKIATRNPAGLADQLSHTIEVEGLASLSFEVTDSEDPIELGGMTEYVVRVVNEGTKAATNVALVAKLLGDLEPIEAQGPVPFEVENLQVEFDPLASLAPADEAVFRVRVRGQKPGNQRVQFLLKSDDQETPLTSEELTHVYADR